VTKPFFVVVEGPAARGDLAPLVKRIGATDGVTGAALAESAVKGDLAVIEAIPTVDGSSKAVRPIIKRLHDDTLPALQATVPGSKLTLGGFPTEERGFISTTYGTFPWVLAFVVILTFILLMRAFRSLILPLKAVILNLVSLAAAFGIIVIIFQNGHGSERFWGVPATGSIISWIPLMIFAFLFGLSMDYEVFMLTRMREGYDETGSTSQAIALGLSRTGKLVTSAALVLMFAFFVLSTGPGTDIKQFGIGLAAGIIFDATVIRALLVPALMQLMGRWNWWLPAGLAKVLHVKPSPLPPAGADR
jgi:RND superfamily putative drug exporter